MIGSVQFMSRQRAEGFRPWRNMAMISVTDPSEQPAKLSPDFRAVLRLSFHDVLHSSMTDVKFFSRDDVDNIIAWLNALHAHQDTIDVVVHCEAGISRSAAIALFIEDAYGVKLHQREKAHDANLRVLHALCRRANRPTPKRPSIPIDNANDKGLRPWF